MGAILRTAKSQKCNQLILLPSPFSPNSLSFLIKAQTHQFLLLGAGTSTLFNAFKTSFSVLEPDPSLTILGNSQHAFLSTNKSAGQNERGVVMLTEAVEKAPS